MPEKMRFVLVRLCECEGNQKGLIARHGELTPLGQRQARMTGRRVCGLGIQAWACPRNSACEATAAIVADGRSVQLVDDFSEPPYGKWAGKKLEYVERRWPREWKRYWMPRLGDAERTVVPGGEPLRTTCERLLKGVDGLYRSAHGVGCVGIVTHGENVRLITTGLLSAPLENLFRLGGRNGAITIFDYDGNTARFECINDTSHLESPRDLADVVTV